MELWMLWMERFVEREINAVSVVLQQKLNNQLLIYKTKERGQYAQIKMKLFLFCFVVFIK